MKMKRLMDTGFAVDEVSSAIDAAGGAKALSLKTKGTTNAGIIGNGEMYISGDGRKVEMENGLMQITSGTELKHAILYEGIICSLAGSSEIFLDLVAKTQKSQEKYRGLDEERMLAIKNELESYRNEWQINHPGKLFECELMVFGLLRGVQTILHQQDDVILVVQDVNSYVVSKFGRGNDPRASGGLEANAHIMNVLSMRDYFSRPAYMHILQQAITIAGLHSQYTGGYIWGYVIGVTPENGFGFLEESFRCHILRSLGSCFDVIDDAGHLDNCLLCVTTNLPYTAFSEAALAYDLRQKYQLLKSLVLGGCLKGDDGDGDHVTVRLLRFADDTSRDDAYYSLPLIMPKAAGDDEGQSIHHAAAFYFQEPGGGEKFEYRMCFYLPSLVNLSSILYKWKPLDF